MSRRLSSSLLAAVVALSPIPLIATSTPAAAQFNVNINVGFDTFYDELSPYGDWNYHPRWGDVWRPRRIGADFRPYSRGYWVNTIEYGWTWETQDPWGDIPYHYGRWVMDPYDGWLWVPGYTWAPAWVVWRQGGGNIGWFPMPPDDRFLAGYDVYRADWNWDRGYFGYSDWYGPSIVAGLAAAWTFVALDRFADRDYYRYAVPQTRVVNIINNTTNITNYITVNNRIVNRSVDVAQVERAAGRRIDRVAARDVVRTPISTIDSGRQIATRERERHGGDVRAPARERVRELPAAEARVPVRERRSVQLERQQAQPGAQQQPDAQDRGGRANRDQQATEPRGRVERDQQVTEPPRGQQGETARQRDERVQREQRQRPDRGAAIQGDVEQQQQRARAEQAERQQKDQAEQQNRARADQAEKQQQRDQVERQRRSQADQQQQQRAVVPVEPSQARGQQAERQQQQAAAAEERRARAQKGKTPEQQEEEERQRRERQK